MQKKTIHPPMQASQSNISVHKNDPCTSANTLSTLTPAQLSALANMLAQFESNTLSPIQADTKSDSITFADWAATYLSEYVAVSCKPSAIEHYSDNLEKHIIPEIGALPLAGITTADIQGMLRRQELHGNCKTGGRLSAKSIRNLRTVASACFAQAVESNLISCNPVSGTVVHKATRPRVEIMEEESLQALKGFIYTDGNLMNVGIILAAEYALRRGEICALRWRDYNGMYLHISETVKRLKKPDNNTLPQGTAKTQLVFCSAKSEDSIRHLAVSPASQAFLDAQKQRFFKMFDRPAGSDDFIVFNSEGGLTDPDNLTHYFADLLDGLGLPHVKLHALRHTFASRAIEMGIDIDSVSGILGHSSVSTTSYYYLRPRQKGMNDALWKLSGAAAAAPASLPCIVRGRNAEHKHTRRNDFSQSA